VVPALVEEDGDLAIAALGSVSAMWIAALAFLPTLALFRGRPICESMVWSTAIAAVVAMLTALAHVLASDSASPAALSAIGTFGPLRRCAARETVDLSRGTLDSPA